MMVVIRKRQPRRKVHRSFRLRPDLVEKIEEVAKELGESRTYVIESLLEYALAAYEKEQAEK